MRYLFLMHGDEETEQNLPAEELKALMERHERFANRMRELRKYVAGAGLAPTATATTVWRSERDGAASDGPYRHADRQLGGIYLIDCDDVDDALRIAREIPLSPGLVIEMRPAPW